MVTAAPPKPPPPAPPPAPNSKATGNGGPKKQYAISRGTVTKCKRIVLYGPGGIGKTTLCANLTQAGISPLIIDLDEGSNEIETNRIGDIRTWAEMRDVLHQESLFDGIGAVIVDTGTKAQDLALAHIVENVPHEKGHKVERIEDYGWGKGYSHLYEHMLLLLGDLDAHYRQGRHVVLVCHDTTATKPNPGGEDWLQYQPNLYHNKTHSVRLRVREWCDILAFAGYDVLAKDGKAKTIGVRTIYMGETPTQMSKGRRVPPTVQFSETGLEFWQAVLNQAT